MKSILIGGVPRSGKSTLANLLLAKGYSVLRGDKIMSALVKTHSELNIARKPTPEQAIRERTPYLFALLRKLANDDSIPYVLDSALLAPDVVRQQGDDLLSICIPVFVGYPEAEVGPKFEQIKTHADRNCFSHGTADEDVLRWIDRWIAESREIRNQCLKYGFEFVNTSHSFEPSLVAAADGIAEQNPNQASQRIAHPGGFANVEG